MDRGELQTIEGLDLPELEKQGGRIHYYQELDAGEFLFILKCLDADGSGIDPDKWPDVIQRFARDGDGKRLFPKAHRERILKWPATTLVRVIHGMEPMFITLADSLKKT